jgi:hypothetical protein
MTLQRNFKLRSSLTVSLSLVAIALLALIFNAAAARAIPDVLNSEPLKPIVSASITSTLIIPKLPVGAGSPTVDGSCNDNQYGSADIVTFPDAGGMTGTVKLIHDTSDLYVCYQGALGTFKDRFASVYVDTNNGRESLAQADDYGLKVMISGGAISSYRGTGTGGYTSTVLAGWTAASAIAPAAEGAEYKIPLNLLGGQCGQAFGLAVYHHWVNTGSGDDYGWPSAQYYDSPATWQQVALEQQFCDSGKIAYVYRLDTATAADFKAMLESAGYTVQLIPQSAVATTDFAPFNLIIVADDTGNLNQWGTPPVSVTNIISVNLPIIGLGEGGYAFFGRAGSPIGWPNGWHGPQDKVTDTGLVLSYYRSPHDLSSLLPGPFPIYAAPVNEVGIFMPAVPASVIPIGWEPLTPQPDHASLTLDGCYHLWGYSGGPIDMDGNGQRLFLNAVYYMRHFQCAAPPPPPSPNCLTVVKTAQPAPPGPVNPGTAIQYTLSYTVPVGTACPQKEATLLDDVPSNTLFVPGSAGGVTPNSEGTLAWPLGTLSSGSSGSKTFKVQVLDTACNDQRVITNTATVIYGGVSFNSNTVTHNVTCPPVIFPNPEPPYAEDEIQVYPYPIVGGHSTQLSVRVRSLSATTQTVTVTFMTSPDRFGIGLPFGALPVPGNPRVVTLGPGATAEVQIDWTPISSGHYCIQVKVEGSGFQPIYTQRNLDVTEDLRPNVENVLPFKVANPTTTTATIDLVVDNTCPGWTAWVTPTQLLAVAPFSADVRNAELHVIPPGGGSLGTSCHIDVQGWIGDHLIGGIRKLDVPPVHLPPSNPPWLEREISTIPTPPVLGATNQVCIELQNPLGFTRTVTVTFSAADFGAGVPFTPFTTQSFDLPPFSLQKYCVNWTPSVSGTLHRCLLVTLQQPGFHDQRSQRNVDLVRRPPGWNPSGVSIPFVVGNPLRYPGEVNLNGILIGLNNWMPQFDPPPPYMLEPGMTQNVMLHLVPAVLHVPNAANADATIAGDAVRVDVSMSLNGEPYSGFSVDFAPPFSVYLPVVLK